MAGWRRELEGNEDQLGPATFSPHSTASNEATNTINRDHLRRPSGVPLSNCGRLAKYCPVVGKVGEALSEHERQSARRSGIEI